MKPRLLLASSEPPGVGGSSTASYSLFRRMLSDGHDVHYVTLLSEDDAPFYRLIFAEDPATLEPQPRAGTCWLAGYETNDHPELRDYIAAIDPDVMVAFGFLATRFLTGAATGRPTLFVTGTCRQAQDHVTRGGAADVISLARGLSDGTYRPRIIHRAERLAVEQASLVMTHSPLVLELMTRFFAPSIGKIFPIALSKAEWICADADPWRHLARPFAERDIDALFVASDWARTEKNYPMVLAIAARLPGVSVHVAGETAGDARSVTHHGFVPTREKLFALMGRARTVVCPSTIDAAPGILFEASVLGCNIVASKNCGNWELCHPGLLADPYTPDVFAACIGRARSHKHDDQLDRFLDLRSYSLLMRVVEAMADPFERQAAG